MPEILQPADFQDPADPAIALAESRETKIAVSIRAGLRAIRNSLEAVDLPAMVSSHNSVGIATAISGPSVQDALRASYKPIAETFTDAAEMETAEKLGGIVVYDPLAAAGQLAGAQQTFIGSVLGQAATTVRDQLLQALRMGADPEEIAKALKGVIGLTPRQAQAVSNFRSLLEGGDRAALSRQLRDRRFDGTVQNWLEGAPIDQAKVDAMVERYADRYLAYRAATIARTESLKATVMGIRDAYVQAVETGRLLPNEVRRRWLVVPDERLCPICASVPLLNPHGVSVLEPYLSLEGPIMGPLAHPNCRCTESFTTDLSRVQANPFRLAA